MKTTLNLTLALLACSLATLLPAETLEEALAEMDARMEASVTEFQTVIEAINEEKLPLVQAISQIEQEIQNLEIELGGLEEDARRADLRVADLREEISSYQSQTEYTEGILREYLNTFESRLHVAEDQAYTDELTRVREALENTGLEAEAKAGLLLHSINMSLDRLPKVIGGQNLESRALLEDGSLLPGEVFIIGPTAIFSSPSDPERQGLLAFQPNSLEPNLVPLPGSDRGIINDFRSSLNGPLPLDPTLGKATTIAVAQGDLVEHLRKGGPVGVAILILGGIALIISLVKLWDLRPVSNPPAGSIATIAGHLGAGKLDEAGEAAQAIKGVVSEMLHTGVQDGKGHLDQTEEIMLGTILRRKTAWERFLPFLAMTAAAAPLLGLLGTVVGMIKTFTLITVFGSGDAKALSSGISEALITTELGLLVAIPALLLHGTFSRLVRNNLNTLETVASDLMLAWSAKTKEPAIHD